MDWDAIWSILISVIQLAVVLTALAFVIRIIIRNARERNTKKAEELARAKWMKEKESLVSEKALDWTCKTCGHINHNRELCESCGSTKTV